MKLEPGPLGSQPYLVKVPGGLSGKLNKNVKMHCFSALVQSPCITWENQCEMKPRSLRCSCGLCCSCGFTVLYNYENFALHSCELKAFLYCWLSRSIHFSISMLTPKHCARMQHQVRKLFPYVVESFQAYFLSSKHLPIKPMWYGGEYGQMAKALCYAQAHNTRTARGSSDFGSFLLAALQSTGPVTGKGHYKSIKWVITFIQCRLVSW